MMIGIAGRQPRAAMRPIPAPHNRAASDRRRTGPKHLLLYLRIADRSISALDIGEPARHFSAIFVPHE